MKNLKTSFNALQFNPEIIDIYSELTISTGDTFGNEDIIYQVCYILTEFNALNSVIYYEDINNRDVVYYTSFIKFIYIIQNEKMIQTKSFKPESFKNYLDLLTKETISI
jgi:hypothetical protein